MATAGFPGAFPGGLTTGNLAIGAVQKQVTGAAGYPGVFPGGLTTGYLNIGAVQKVVASGATGTLATTNANDTSAATGTTTIVGTLARTNANDTSAAQGTTTILGTLARTNANDTSAAQGTTTVTGTLATTNANDTVVASGTGGSPTGTVAYTNNNDTIVASGTVVSTNKDGSRPKRKLYKYDKKSKELDWIFRDIRDFYVELTDASMPKAVRQEAVDLVRIYSNDVSEIPDVNSIKWQAFEADTKRASRFFDLWIANVPVQKPVEELKKAEAEVVKLDNKIADLLDGSQDIGEPLSDKIMQLKLMIEEEKAYIKMLEMVKKAKKTPGSTYKQYHEKKKVINDIAYITAYMLNMEE